MVQNPNCLRKEIIKLWMSSFKMLIWILFLNLRMQSSYGYCLNFSFIMQSSCLLYAVSLSNFNISVHDQLERHCNVQCSQPNFFLLNDSSLVLELSLGVQKTIATYMSFIALHRCTPNRPFSQQGVKEFLPCNNNGHFSRSE